MGLFFSPSLLYRDGFFLLVCVFSIPKIQIGWFQNAGLDIYFLEGPLWRLFNRMQRSDVTCRGIRRGVDGPPGCQ